MVKKITGPNFKTRVGPCVRKNDPILTVAFCGILTDSLTLQCMLFFENNNQGFCLQRRVRPFGTVWYPYTTLGCLHWDPWLMLDEDPRVRTKMH